MWSVSGPIDLEPESPAAPCCEGVSACRDSGWAVRGAWTAWRHDIRDLDGAHLWLRDRTSLAIEDLLAVAGVGAPPRRVVEGARP
jgi:hypothetical protein